MKNLKKKIFKKAGKLIALKISGERVQINGVLLKKAGNYLQNECTEFGIVANPIYTYMGDTELAAGDELLLGNERFSVVEAELVEAFGISFCAKAMLEKVLN